MNRREFLKKAALAGVAGIGAVKALNGISISAAGVSMPGIIVAQNGEPEKLLEAALAVYGGLEKLIKPKSTVVIKANFSWRGTPEKAGTTNPELLAALVKACRRAGAGKVRVVDLAIDPARMCLNESGIQKAVTAAGGEIEDLRAKAPITKINQGVLKDFAIYTEAIKADCLINVPILKHHVTMGLSCALKHLMGLTPDRRLMHTMNIDQAIVDLAKVIKPHLHIIDAYRIMTTRGPQPGGDVELAKQLILTHDPVAGDAYAASLLKSNPAHVRLAAAAGLGSMDLNRIKITKVNA